VALGARRVAPCAAKRVAGSLIQRHVETPGLELRGLDRWLWCGCDTEFRFVTDGIHAALQRAKDAAGNRDIRLGGGRCCSVPGRRCGQASICLHSATNP